MVQIISLANNLDNKFELKESCIGKEKCIIKYVESKRDKWFSSEIVDSLYNIVT